jgi:hypothetical protein
VERHSIIKVTSLESQGAALMLALKWPPVPVAITPFVLGIGSGVATIVAFTSRPTGDVEPSTEDR